MFETHNEPSFAEIGPKLTSVDKKVSSIVVLSFSDKELFISLIFSNHFMGIDTTCSENDPPRFLLHNTKPLIKEQNHCGKQSTNMDT